MASKEEKIKRFHEMPYEKKKEICINILTILTEKGNAQAGRILKTVQRLSKVPESLLKTIFQDFEDSVENIKEGKKQEELHVFEKSKDYINDLRQKEAEQRAQENPDDLLSQL